MPTDPLWPFLQAVAMAIAVTVVHTYYGYHASDGPVVVVITPFISLAVYGAAGGFTLSG